MIRYLSVEQVVSLHQRLVGHLTDVGVRDELTEHHYQCVLKAAALLHALTTTAPFRDAAPETALLAAECFLVANGATLHATDRDLVHLGAAVASGEMSVDSLAIWIRQRTGRLRIAD